MNASPSYATVKLADRSEKALRSAVPEKRSPHTSIPATYPASSHWGSPNHPAGSPAGSSPRPSSSAVIWGRL